MAASATFTDQIAGLPSHPFSDIPSKICFIPGGIPKPPSVGTDPSTSPLPPSSALVPPAPEPLDVPALLPPPPLLPDEPPLPVVVALELDALAVETAPPPVLPPDCTEAAPSEQATESSVSPKANPCGRDPKRTFLLRCPGTRQSGPNIDNRV